MEDLMSRWGVRWTQTELDAKRSRGLAAMHAAPSGTKKPAKFLNVKTTDAEGRVHDSGKEYRNWCALELRAKAGEIRNLRRQVRYACVVNGQLICEYVADAVYEEGAATIVEDTKSPKTRLLPAYRIKLKLMQALHGIQIREV